jgi:hypothetical protein
MPDSAGAGCWTVAMRQVATTFFQRRGEERFNFLPCFFAAAFFSLNSIYPYGQKRKVSDYNILYNLMDYKAGIQDACRT